MSQRLLGILVAIAFAISTPYVNAGTQHGCGQVANPCGDCYGGSVVDPDSNGGATAGDNCCGQEVRFVTRTVYENQMMTQMRTVSRTRMNKETRTRECTVNVQVPTKETQTYTVMVPKTSMKTENYTVRVPYTENVTMEYQTRRPVTEMVEKTYQVCVPYA